MKINKYSLFSPLAFGILALVFLTGPQGVEAATAPDPDCVLLVQSSAGIYAGTGQTEALQVVGDPVKIFWLSSNATKAENKNGTKVPIFGLTYKNPKSDTTYTYTFKNNEKEVDCGVVIHPVKGSIDTDSLVTDSKKPTLSGKATNLKEVKLSIYKVGTKTLVYESDDVEVSGGSWEHEVDESLSDGQYDVVLKANDDWKLNQITKQVLSVGDVSQINLPGTIVVQPIPLLSGGNAKGGAKINLLYLQMINVSNDPVTITGIKLKQTGTASTDSILSLMATDDTNVARTEIGSLNNSPFSSQMATIPITLTLKPKETRLFTLNTTLKSNISSYIGDTIKLEVIGVNSRSSIKGDFPIRGVSWLLNN